MKITMNKITLKNKVRPLLWKNKSKMREPKPNNRTKTTEKLMTLKTNNFHWVRMIVLPSDRLR